ncbi:MAG: cytochrome c biogenesis protein CcdA [Elusimicrobia bacterium]|nr:cytochrome c biogenesis protein CcdA [Elusimicrobiota bacterium]
MRELGLSFLAGLASFLSPCVLPLIPVYLAFLTGSSFAELTTKTPRHVVIINALAFIGGFSLVFIAMGASASALGAALADHRAWIERLGGAVLLAFGLWQLGVIRMDFLYKDARMRFREKPAGLAGSVLVGGAFAAGWTPCVGPQLGAALSLASLSGSVGKGVLLLAAYSAGFAVPLLLCAVAVERAVKVLDRLKKWLPVFEKASGALLVVLGLTLAGGYYGKVSTGVLAMFPGWAKMFTGLGL